MDSISLPIVVFVEINRILLFKAIKNRGRGEI